MKNGVMMLEVYTINGIYNVLYDGNQRNEKTAYYIGGNFATYQNGKKPVEIYDKGEYFVISNASLVTDTTELELFVNFNEMIEICKQNNWMIDYSYR